MDQSSYKDFKNFAFEVQTIANQYLAPPRIKEYLGIVHKDQGSVEYARNQRGAKAAKATMYYVLLVSAKYLTMMTSYYIQQRDAAGVQKIFSKFNNNFEEYRKIYTEITSEEIAFDGLIE